MNAPRTIPRATLIAALETLGIDIPLSDIMDIHLTGNAVTATTWPHFEALGWRIVDECPSCHAAGDHPHTDYCQAAKVRTCHVCGCTDLAACPGGCAWVPGEPDLCTACQPAEILDLPAGYGHRLVPSDTLIPGVTVDEPEPWVDDGCRCPSRDNHRAGCPVLEPQPDPDFEDPGISENGK